MRYEGSWLHSTLRDCHRGVIDCPEKDCLWLEHSDCSVVPERRRDGEDPLYKKPSCGHFSSKAALANEPQSESNSLEEDSGESVYGSDSHAEEALPQHVDIGK